MRRLMIAVLVFCGLYLSLGRFTDLRSYRSLPAAELIREGQVIESKIVLLKEADSKDMSESHSRELHGLIVERAKVIGEQVIRRYYLDPLVTVALVFTLFMLAASYLRSRQNLMASSKEEAIRDMQVQVDPPGEEYVDEWELERRVAEAFRNKNDAIEFIKNDPLLKCEYCVGQLRSSFTGHRESVQLVTFYKRVPPGAKDLRVTLGSFWFAKHADELRCSRCAREVKR